MILSNIYIIADKPFLIVEYERIKKGFIFSLNDCPFTGKVF